MDVRLLVCPRQRRPACLRTLSTRKSLLPSGSSPSAWQTSVINVCCSVAQPCPSLLTPWTAAHQAPLPRREHWSGLPFPPPGDLPDPGIQPTCLVSPLLVGGSFASSATWGAHVSCISRQVLLLVTPPEKPTIPIEGCFDQRKGPPHSPACDEHGQASLHASFNQNASTDLTPSAALGLGLQGQGWRLVLRRHSRPAEPGVSSLPSGGAWTIP